MSSTRRASPSLPLLPDSRVRFKSPEPRSRPLVHYPDNIDDEKPRRPGYHSSVSTDAVTPRPLSSAGTDDDSDEYDWSGEDDLVDEEAKYEKKMGVSDRPNRWGIRRSVPIDIRTVYSSPSQRSGRPLFISHRLHLTCGHSRDPWYSPPVPVV